MSSPIGPFSRSPSPAPAQTTLSQNESKQTGQQPPVPGPTSQTNSNLVNKLILSPANKSIASMSPDEYRAALAHYHQEIKSTEENLRNLQKALNPMRFVEQLVNKLKS